MTQGDVLKALGRKKLTMGQLCAVLDDSKSVVYRNICTLRKFKEVDSEYVSVRNKKSLGGKTYYKLYFRVWPKK